MNGAVIFDLEGTLWDSLPSMHRAWNRVLKRNRVERPPLCREELNEYLGHGQNWVARRMLPELPPPEQQRIMEECMQEAQLELERSGGRPYPGMKLALESLRRDYDLYVISNCMPAVQQAFLNCGYGRYFSGVDCSEPGGKSKLLRIRDLVRHNGLQMVCYVGDSLSDWEASAALHIPFVHAAYGMEPTMPGWVAAHSPAELPEKIREVFPVK